MKLKTKLFAGFIMVILVPQLLLSATLFALSKNQSNRPESVSSYEISISDPVDEGIQIRMMARDLLFTTTIILVFTALLVGIWIYRSISSPMAKLQRATQEIRDGNLDFTLDVSGKDEFGDLFRDFDEMRVRLKESAEEKLLLDKENKELISNI